MFLFGGHSPQNIKKLILGVLGKAGRKENITLTGKWQVLVDGWDGQHMHQGRLLPGIGSQTLASIPMSLVRHGNKEHVR